MATLTIKHFDVHDFVKKSKELGVDEKVAEYQARQIEQAIDIAVTVVKEELRAEELATKKDLKELDLKLELKIAEAKNQIIIWMGGLIITSGLLQHFFK